MRYGILGDVHSNLSALRAVLECLERDVVDVVLSVGDIVGYGAAPEECIGVLRELEVAAVKGNHDAACVGEIDASYFNPMARAAVDWTRGRLGRADLEWLRALPMVLHFSDCSVAHGTLSSPEKYEYIQSVEDADPSLDAMHTPVCFVGHTHVPVAMLRMTSDPSRTAYTLEPQLDLDELSRALVNVGSVGQPRDEDPRAAYGLYDSDLAKVWVRRVEYDIAAEAHRIRKAGLPGMLADRLFFGV